MLVQVLPVPSSSTDPILLPRASRSSIPLRLPQLQVLPLDPLFLENLSTLRQSTSHNDRTTDLSPCRKSQESRASSDQLGVSRFELCLLSTRRADPRSFAFVPVLPRPVLPRQCTTRIALLSASHHANFSSLFTAGRGLVASLSFRSTTLSTLPFRPLRQRLLLLLQPRGSSLRSPPNSQRSHRLLPVRRSSCVNSSLVGSVEVVLA